MRADRRGERWLRSSTDHDGLFVRVRAPAIAFLAGAIAHVESLTYWFTSSDTLVLVESARVGSPADLAGVFTRPMLAGTRFVDVALFYRPLSTLSFALDYFLWGLNPAGYHLTNVLLHGVAAALATVALAAVTRRRGAGLLGGLLFAVHPLTAEVVPAVGRRQDVLMTALVLGAFVLFVRSRSADEDRPTAGYDGGRSTRRERWRGSTDGTGDRRALVGSLGLYALALLAKEPALVFPGLVAAWAALDYGLDDGRPLADPAGAVRSALRAVAPYVVVTGGYFAVRLSVLGGLGGYRETEPTEVADLVIITVEYPLSLAYHQGVVGAATVPGMGAAWRVVGLAMALAAGVALLAAVAVTRERGPSAGTVGALVAAAALAAVPLAIRFEGALRRELPYLYDYGNPTIVTAYPRPSSPVVGLLLVGGVLAGAAWAVDARPAPLAARDRAALALFGVWLAGPLALFYATGDYTVRSGYLSVVPATGALGLVLAVGAEGLRDRPAVGADLALVGLACVLVVPMVATSPLVAAYDGWETSGRINERALTGVAAAVDGTDPGTPVDVEDMVIVIADRGCAFPRAKSVLYARPATVEAWLGLHGHDRHVRAGGGTVLDRRPAEVTVERTASEDVVEIQVDYAGTVDGGCVTTPWERSA